MRRVAVARPLTAGQKELLAVVARTGDVTTTVEDEHVEAYRMLNLDGWEGEPATIKHRITRLCQRPDAALILRGHRARREAVIRHDLLKSDHAVGETLISTQEMQQDSLNALYDLALLETERFRADKTGRRTAKAAVDAWDKVRKATAGVGGGRGLSQEEALALFEAKMAERQAARSPEKVAVNVAVPSLDDSKPLGKA